MFIKRITNYWAIVILLSMISVFNSGYALVPLESLIYGDSSHLYSEEKTDPLNYVFLPDQVEEEGAQRVLNREKLMRYMGFIKEGENLGNYCSSDKRDVLYRNSWDQEQVKRTVVSTLQYIGLDITTRAISKYAKYFEFSQEDFNNLTERLVVNYCSKNLTVISLRELKKNLKILFEKGEGLILPTVDGNTFFPASLKDLNQVDKSTEQEFLQTIKLFRAFCSWGGDAGDMRLMVPLLRHPIVIAFVIRQMIGKKLAWRPSDNTLFLKSTDQTVTVQCQNLICRKTDRETFLANLPRAIGSQGVQNDLENLFCHDFKSADYLYMGQAPQVKKWIDEQSLADQKFLVSQFLALITGIPDFFVRAAKFNDGKEFMRASLDLSWDEWARKRLSNFSKDLYYEEFLRIEKIDRRFFFNPYVPDFKVVFDIDLGEFDRVNKIIGKLTVKFDLKLSNAFLKWIRNQWINVSPLIKNGRKMIIERFKQQIKIQVEEGRKKFKLPPWEGDLALIIVKELLGQLISYQGDFSDMNPSDFTHIPIEFNYGPFAIRYLRYQHLVQKNEEESLK